MTPITKQPTAIDAVPLQRARDILTRACSGHVTWLDRTDRPAGRVPGVVLVTGSSCTHGAPAVVEIADPAPLPVRDRVRARLRIHGYAAFPAPGAEVAVGDTTVGTTAGTTAGAGGTGEAAALHVRPLAIELDLGNRTVAIAPDALARTTADPFALTEGPLLSHLANGHPAELGALRRLLPVALHQARVVPLALDAQGLTLRAERETEAGWAHRDVRLGFDGRAATGEELLEQLRILVQRGRKPQLPSVFRAGPAAARICRPEL